MGRGISCQFWLGVPAPTTDYGQRRLVEFMRDMRRCRYHGFLLIPPSYKLSLSKIYIRALTRVASRSRRQGARRSGPGLTGMRGGDRQFHLNNLSTRESPPFLCLLCHEAITLLSVTESSGINLFLCDVLESNKGKSDTI